MVDLLGEVVALENLVEEGEVMKVARKCQDLAVEAEAVPKQYDHSNVFHSSCLG